MWAHLEYLWWHIEVYKKDLIVDVRGESDVTEEKYIILCAAIVIVISGVNEIY